MVMIGGERTNTYNPARGGTRTSNPTAQDLYGTTVLAISATGATIKFCSQPIQSHRGVDQRPKCLRFLGEGYKRPPGPRFSILVTAKVGAGRDGAKSLVTRAHR